MSKVNVTRQAINTNDVGDIFTYNNGGGDKVFSIGMTESEQFIIGPNNNLSNGNAFVMDQSGNIYINGNLTVEGTTTTVNSNIVDLEDPILRIGTTLNTGVNGSDGVKRGIEFEYNYNSGIAQNTGFFGVNSSKDAFIFDPLNNGTLGKIHGGSLESDGTLLVDGVSTLSGNAFVSGAFDVSGATTFQDTLVVDGISTFSGNAFVSGAFDVSGATTFQDTLVVDGVSTFSGNAFVSGAFDVSGATTFQDTLVVDGVSTLSGNAFVSGAFDVSGATTFQDTLVVDGVSTFNNDVSIEGNLSSTSSSTESDIKLKENINTLENSLENILKLRGVSYYWKDKVKKGERKQIGLIAQELEEVYPEFIINKKEENGEIIKTVNYSQIVSILIEALKEQQNEIEYIKENYSKKRSKK